MVTIAMAMYFITLNSLPAYVNIWTSLHWFVTHIYSTHYQRKATYSDLNLEETQYSDLNWCMNPLEMW